MTAPRRSHVAQLAEAADSNPVQCRFDSDRGNYTAPLWLWVLVLVVSGLAVLAMPAQSEAASQVPRRGTVAYCYHAAVGVARRACVVRVVFAPVGESRKAVAVAWCESRLDPRARNGRFEGVFQMGDRERRRFGHGPTVEQQARAALRYYRVSGWRPWSCA